MVLPAPLQTSSYRVFLSSGDDVVPLRDRAERLSEIASEVLSRSDRSSRLEIDRWEDAAPHVVDTDKVTDEFVGRALASHMVVALLLNEIRPGTFEELEAVLALSERCFAAGAHPSCLRVSSRTAEFEVGTRTGGQAGGPAHRRTVTAGREDVERSRRDQRGTE